ncbi:hypothetical protein ACFXPY_30890 [Streptomyces sp. NPDC059153]|uniref:hypothetical protein n=1 Tax=unclassified Streptomyces TaxID=2593676 RepID=UPI0036C6DAED
MVSTAHARIDPETARPTASFTDCAGRNGESADDGRFTLRYSVRGTLPRSEHPEDQQFVSVGSVDKDLLVFVVSTPCLLPPGVDQQQF